MTWTSIRELEAEGTRVAHTDWETAMSNTKFQMIANELPEDSTVAPKSIIANDEMELFVE